MLSASLNKTFPSFRSYFTRVLVLQIRAHTCCYRSYFHMFSCFVDPSMHLLLSFLFHACSCFADPSMHLLLSFLFHACSCFADPSSHLLLSCVFALSVKYQPADVSLAVSCGLLPALDLLSRDAALHPYTMLPPREWLAARDVHTILQVSSYRLLQVIAVTVGWVLFSQFISSVSL